MPKAHLRGGWHRRSEMTGGVLSPIILPFTFSPRFSGKIMSELKRTWRKYPCNTVPPARHSGWRRQFWRWFCCCAPFAPCPRRCAEREKRHPAAQLRHQPHPFHWQPDLRQVQPVRAALRPHHSGRQGVLRQRDVVERGGVVAAGYTGYSGTRAECLKKRTASFPPGIR